MNLYTVCRLVIKHLLLVLLCTAVCGAIAVTLALVTPPTFSVHIQMFVSSTGVTPADRAQNGDYARNRVSSYADLVTSPAVLDVVRANLALADPYYALVDGIDAENPLDTAIVNVTVRDSSPERAFEVADQISQVMGPVVSDLEASETGVSPIKVSVVRPPIPPTGPDSPNKKLYAMAGLFVGVAVGIGAAHLREAWPRTLVRATSARRTPAERSTDGWDVVPGPDARQTLPDRRAVVVTREDR